MHTLMSYANDGYNYKNCTPAFSGTKKKFNIFLPEFS